MGINSAIEWTDHTWNPHQGCTKISEGCAHCYMFRDMKRYGRNPEEVRRSAKGTFNAPLAKDRQGNYKIAARSKVFTCSWSDWFHEEADEWRHEAWDIIRRRPDVVFQIVTKRPERISECLPSDWGDGWTNVWLLITAENQRRLEERIYPLLQTPAIVRGISAEPLLGPLDVQRIRVAGDTGFYTLDALRGQWYGTITRDVLPAIGKLHWIIAGGESGPHARPSHRDWFRKLRDQCQAGQVPFFFKQWGEWAPANIMTGPDPWPYGKGRFAAWLQPNETFPNSMTGWSYSTIQNGMTCAARIGKEAAGRKLDGRQWNEFPNVAAVAL